MLFCKLATADPLFLLLPQKKTLAKEKGIGGIANFPPNPLKAPKKTLRLSWIFPA